jgi:Icc-related predicted phosphoesterase
MTTPDVTKRSATRIVAMADIHGNMRMIERAAGIIRGADLVIIAGDITHTGRVAEAGEVIALVESFNRNILAVHGNWDEPAVEGRLRETGIGLHASGRIINGIGFFGLGGSSPTPIPTRTVYREDEIPGLLRSGAAEIEGASTRVLISHGPPRGLRDRTFLYLRGGSKSLRAYIESERVDLCVCGHIHEAGGIERFRDTVVANTGAFKKGSYTAIEIRADGTIACEMGRLDLR